MRSRRLWVTTLGHRVPELDQAVRDQLDRVAHSTMLGNGNRIVIEFAEALARVVPVDRPHTLFAVRRRSRGRAGAEDRVSVLGQPRGIGSHHVSRLRQRVSRRHDRLAVAGRRRLRYASVRSTALPGHSRTLVRATQCVAHRCRTGARTSSQARGGRHRAAGARCGGNVDCAGRGFRRARAKHAATPAYC